VAQIFLLGIIRVVKRSNFILLIVCAILAASFAPVCMYYLEHRKPGTPATALEWFCCFFSIPALWISYTFKLSLRAFQVIQFCGAFIILFWFFCTLFTVVRCLWRKRDA